MRRFVVVKLRRLVVRRGARLIVRRGGRLVRRDRFLLDERDERDERELRLRLELLFLPRLANAWASFPFKVSRAPNAGMARAVTALKITNFLIMCVMVSNSKTSKEVCYLDGFDV